MMHYANHQEAHHTFRVQCSKADHVYLLLRLHQRFAQVLPMTPVARDDGATSWGLELRLPAGDHQYYFYAYQGDRLLLCSPLESLSPAPPPEPSAPRNSDNDVEKPAPAAWPDRWSRFPASRPSDYPFTPARSERPKRPGHDRPFHHQDP